MCLLCMIAFILHSFSNFGDILSVFIPVDFSECALPVRAQ